MPVHIKHRQMHTKRTKCVHTHRAHKVRACIRNTSSALGDNAGCDPYDNKTCVRIKRTKCTCAHQLYEVCIHVHNKRAMCVHSYQAHEVCTCTPNTRSARVHTESYAVVSSTTGARSVRAHPACKVRVHTLSARSLRVYIKRTKCVHA